MDPQDKFFFAASNDNLLYLKEVADEAGFTHALRDKDGRTPLIRAAARNATTVMEYLIQQGADVNACDPEHKYTGLMEAACYNHADAAQMLLDAEADINMVNKNGRTALMEAVIAQATDTLQVLATHPDTDFSIADPEGRNIDAWIDNVGTSDMAQIIAHGRAQQEMNKHLKRKELSSTEIQASKNKQHNLRRYIKTPKR